MQVTKDAVQRMASLPQFHGVPTRSLIRVAAVKTGLRVPNRWAAIALILSNPCPIPVAPAGLTGSQHENVR